MFQTEALGCWWSLYRSGEPDNAQSFAVQPSGKEDRILIRKGEIVRIEMSGGLLDVRAVLQRLLEHEHAIMVVVRPYMHSPNDLVPVDLKDLYAAVEGLRLNDD